MGEFGLGFPIARRISRHLMAGEPLEEAIEAVWGLNRKRLLATIDHLEEGITS